MWFLEQNSPTHFALAIELEGNTTVEDWRNALNAMQRRHSLLSVYIHQDSNGVPYFSHVQNTQIPRPVIEDQNASLDEEL